MAIKDEILGNLPARLCGSRPWHERIPPKLLEELEQLRDGWRSGEIVAPKATLARAISEAVTKRGTKIGQQGVEHWLGKR